VIVHDLGKGFRTNFEVMGALEFGAMLVSRLMPLLSRFRHLSDQLLLGSWSYFNLSSPSFLVNKVTDIC
jgi:hypothetical protein